MLFETITYHDASYGTAYARSSLDILNENILAYSIIGSVASLMLIEITALFIVSLKRIPIQPATDLAESVNHVARTHDYQRCALIASHDGLGPLYHGSKGMMDKIQASQGAAQYRT